jgi:hypothetical protein
MKKLNIFLLLISAILITSCQKEIDFNGEISEPKIVLNSYVSPDSMITAHLSKSRFFLSNETKFEFIANGTINLYINDVWKEKMQYLDNGIYIASYQPNPGDKVTMKVQVQGFDEVVGTTIIPLKTNLISVDTTQVLTSYRDEYIGSDIAASYQNYDCTFNIKIKDEPEKENFYRIVMKRIFSDGFSSEIYESFMSFSLEGFDNQGNNLFDFIAGQTEEQNDQQVLNDELFNGKEINFKIKQSYYFLKIMPGFEEYFNKSRSTESIQINIQSISKDLYLFLKTKEASNNNIGNIFSEPVLIYNNVENGIGILGSYTNQVKKIDLY